MLGALACSGFLAGVGISGCASAPAGPGFVKVLADQPQLTVFAGLVAESGMQSQLENGSDLTVFAPTNEAFLALPANTLDKFSSPDMARSLVQFHILPRRIDVSNAPAEPSGTLLGAPLPVARSGAFLTAGDAIVTQTIPVGKGLLHVIDRVQLPPSKR